MFDFDLPVDRRGTYSMKWDDDGYFKKMVSGIRLDNETVRIMLADNDFRCPPAITAAMHRVADFPNYGYTTADSAPMFRTSVCDWYRKRYDTEVSEESIVYVSGALDGVGRTITAFSQEGDGVIICRPVYSNFTSTIKGLGRQVVNVPLINEECGKYEMDWENFEKACAEETNKVYVLCSPANPIGKVWTKEELCRMAEICRKNNVVLVSDEIHSDLTRQGVKNIPVVKAVEDLSNIILVSGANKTFNIMGLHCAYCIIPDEKLRADFESRGSSQMPTPFALAAQIAAYEECDEWLDEFVKYTDENMQQTADLIREKLPLAKVYIPEGTYVLWVDFSGYGMTPKQIQYLINHRANVCVQNGTAHDPENGGQYLRICVTSPKAVMKEAIEKIADAFQYIDFAKENVK